ncbi:hypothetical protein [Hyphomicrobium sp.]|uniref:hypothetical protein n=1 Tax=Hyphomicrobium sp. TaxID=82 RepID=UPI003F6FF3F9
MINADCDLAHQKTDGVVAFLPIYSFHDYLSQFWAPGHIQEVVDHATQAVLKLADDSDAAVLHAWLKSSGAEAVCFSIVRYKGLKKSQSDQLDRELRRLAICLDAAQAPIIRFRHLCSAAPDPASYARTHITSAKKAMGEGHFVFSDLVDDQSVGFVIRMRRIYTMPEGDCFVSTSEQMSRSQGDRPTAVRVARLTERYRFKVLQLFSQQYARIGLPDDVTALSALVIDDLVVTFSGVPK